MTTVTLNISGDSQEVISVIQSLAKQQEVSQAPVATEPPPVAANDAAVTSPAPRAASAYVDCRLSAGHAQQRIRGRAAVVGRAGAGPRPSNAH